MQISFNKLLIPLLKKQNPGISQIFSYNTKTVLRLVQLAILNIWSISLVCVFVCMWQELAHPVPADCGHFCFVGHGVIKSRPKGPSWGRGVVKSFGRRCWDTQVPSSLSKQINWLSLLFSLLACHLAVITQLFTMSNGLCMPPTSPSSLQCNALAANVPHQFPHACMPTHTHTHRQRCSGDVLYKINLFVPTAWIY